VHSGTLPRPGLSVADHKGRHVVAHGGLQSHGRVVLRVCPVDGPLSNSGSIESGSLMSGVDFTCRTPCG
jgi:hypothetical protein